MKKLLRQVGVIDFKAQICWGVRQSTPLNMWKCQVPVTCQRYPLLHVRDCLINKNAKRPQVHLTGRRQRKAELQSMTAGTGPGAEN